MEAQSIVSGVRFDSRYGAGVPGGAAVAGTNHVTGSRFEPPCPCCGDDADADDTSCLTAAAPSTGPVPQDAEDGRAFRMLVAAIPGHLRRAISVRFYDPPWVLGSQGVVEVHIGHNPDALEGWGTGPTLAAACRGALADWERRKR